MRFGITALSFNTFCMAFHFILVYCMSMCGCCRALWEVSGLEGSRVDGLTGVWLGPNKVSCRWPPLIQMHELISFVHVCSPAREMIPYQAIAVVLLPSRKEVFLFVLPTEADMGRAHSHTTVGEPTRQHVHSGSLDQLKVSRTQQHVW